MAYSLVTRSFGANNPNSSVSITEAYTARPAIILSSPTGGMVNDKGITRTDAFGDVSIYIDTSRTWTFHLVDEHYSDNSVSAAYRKVASNLELAGLVGQFGTTYVVDGNPAVSYVWNGSKMVPISGFTTEQVTAILSHDVTGSLPAYSFSYGDATPSLIGTITAGSRVTLATLYLDVAFNGIGASLSVGTGGSPNYLIDSAFVDTSTVATFEFSPQVVFSFDTPIYLYITPGSGASSGSGSVLIST